MNVIRLAPSLFVLVPLQAAPASGPLNGQQAEFGFFGGDTTQLQRRAGETCVPPETRQFVRRNVKSFSDGLSRQGITTAPYASDVPFPPRYPFYPQGGTLYRDLLTGNFVDLDPSPVSVRNYLCENYGNDGHQGIDTGGLTWEEMAIGQPVYAALDGVVVDARDGDPDMNTSCQPLGNWVILDHGNGREAWYFHLKKNTVAVQVGNVVAAGEQIGSVGSSGCSFAPHLHFQSMQKGHVYEPFSGPCRSGASGWVHQQDPPPGGAFVRDMGVTMRDIGAAPPLPARAPVDNQIPLSAGGNIYYWIQFGNLPANSSWVERYVRPNGTVEYQIGPFGFGNPTVYQSSQYWFPRLVGGMATTTGTWRIQFEVNGVLLVDAPVRVVNTVSGTFNRPPSVFSATLDPTTVSAGMVVFARVDSALSEPGTVIPDWDIVRYRYVWKVNGNVVRDVVSVGMADALSRQHAVSGNNLEVTITAGDGFGGGLGATAPPVHLFTQVQ